MQFSPEICAEIDQAIEDAGMVGLCRDGQRGFAIDRLISGNSGFDSSNIAIAVDERLREMVENG